MKREDLEALLKNWTLISSKHEARAQKQAREGAHIASAYSSGVSAGMAVAAYDLEALLRGEPLP